MIKDFNAVHISPAAEIERLCFSDPWSEGAFADSLKSEYAHFKVWEEDKVLGYIGFYAVAGEGSITNVAVHPDARGKGIGLALVKEVIALGEKLALDYITLEVRGSNTPARTLYEKCGFRDMGTRRNFYTKPREDAVIMNYFFDKDREN
ncbi:MAG: ribosomal protein S18-alanine N-acetyltransferase [Clostridia bacterium]|nr:ribosomal protein S18-alanine N-acetyltransferase [Clostridia bacterium]